MLKKEITYTDYNGNERKETYWFNLTEAELAEMELSETGGLDEILTRLVETQDVPAIIEIFKDVILKAYGEKSADGKYFLKLDENGRRLSDRFKQTEAYSKLFMELAFNADAASAFVNGIVPSSMKKQVSADN